MQFSEYIKDLVDVVGTAANLSCHELSNQQLHLLDQLFQCYQLVNTGREKVGIFVCLS